MKCVVVWLCVAFLSSLPTVVSAEPFVWTIVDGQFQPHVGQLKSVTSGELQLTRDDGVTESLPLSNVLRWFRPVMAMVRADSETPEPRNGQTVQLNGVSMTITATNATAVTLQAADGRQTSVMTSAARHLLAANAARTRRGPLALILANGDVLTGEPIGLDNNLLTWKNEAVGEIKLPLEQARRLIRLPDKQVPATAPSEDIATLTNGDSVHGVVSALSGESLTVQPLSGEATTVPLDSVKQIRFAQTSVDASPQQRGFVVSLIDGSRLTVATVVSADAGLSLTRLDGTTTSVPLATIQQIEQRGGPVVWLSDLQPTESVQRSFLGRQWPAQFNRAVDGEPLSFGAQTFAHGIGVHSYSKLVFELPEGFDRLHLAYAIEGDSPYADVTARILLDGRSVHEAAHIRAGNLATLPDIQLSHAKQLTLEVDLGNAQDTQDRFEWIEPALLRAVDSGK